MIDGTSSLLNDIFLQNSNKTVLTRNWSHDENNIHFLCLLQYFAHIICFC